MNRRDLVRYVEQHGCELLREGSNSGESRGQSPRSTGSRQALAGVSGGVPPNKNGNPKGFLEPP